MASPTLRIPSEADFGFCPVGEVATIEITVTNSTRQETSFVWLAKEPFTIAPVHGTIAGRKQQTFTISFLPKTASRFDGQLICRYGKELLETSTLTCIGVAKIPHISLSTDAIDFGRVPSGAKAQQTIEVHNSAPVPATVSISSDFGQFIVSPTKVNLKPQGSEKVKITFHPRNFDFYAFATISFSTAGGNSASMRCSAYVTGPRVSIDHTWLSLGAVQLKNSSSNIFNVTNHSNKRVFFQFLIEPTSVFSFDPIQGILPPNYSKSVRVTFTPQHPIAYYRRVILIVHQHQPMAIDVFGSAYDTFNRPPRLKPAIVDANRMVIAEGLGNKPPHLLQTVPEVNLPSCEYVTEDLKRTKCTLSSGTHIFSELFIQRDLVSLSSKHFEFGACQRDVSPEVQTLVVKNNTDSPVTLYWQRNKDGFVTITPDKTDIPKKQSAEIKLQFNPLLEFQFMGSTLEGFAQYKEMRNANIVDFPTLPFLLSPFVDGHTMDDVTSFIPTMFTSHKTLVFTGAISGDSKFQTFYVENRGDCAFKFDARIIDDPNPDKGTVASPASAFAVYPQVGTINKGSFQIFVVKFTPSQRGHYHAQLFASINDSPMNSFSVKLKGDASVPGVSFSVTGTLFLHPVSLGSISSQTIQISNDATVPVRMEWKIPSIYQNLLIVRPQVAEIKSREVIDCVWEFHPDAIGEFRSEVVCNVQPLPNSSNEFLAKELLPYIVGPESLNIDQGVLTSLKTVQHYPLTICTLVTDCVVNSKPQFIDFGFVRINSTASSTLSISNHSDSQMHFLLQPKNKKLKLLTFSPADDVLPPRSSREVEVRFTPHTPGEASDVVLCSLLNESIFQQEGQSGKSFTQFAIKSSASEICTVKAIGCFPHMSIIDIFSSKYSRQTMWTNCQINEINREWTNLGCDALTDNLKEFVIDFGIDTVGADPTSVCISFKNVGHIAFSFSINFPNDISIDPEYWALPDEIDPNQLKQDQIIQTKLFRVSEKKFYLEPNETTTVTFTYMHKFIESHQLPVVLSVQNGRIIRLILKGTTLDLSTPHLVPAVSNFEIQPVPIGSIQPPIQMIKFANPSHCDAEYRIDLTQVQEVAEHNHNFEIFKFLNPSGVIKKRSNGYINFIFKPLEAIEYNVSILCVVSTGNNFTVTIKGRGVHTDHDDCEVVWPVFPPRSLSISNVSLVTLSEHFLDFGDLPVFAKVDRVLFVNNVSDKLLTFEAELPCDAFAVEPRKGEIEPHSKQRLNLSIFCPGVPTIMTTEIPIVFREPREVVDSRSSKDVTGKEEKIIAADPPINSRGGGRMAGLRRLKEREENWKSVGERTLEATQRIKQNDSNLFSTHVGQRGGDRPADFAAPAAVHYIDIVFNGMAKDEYREKYGSIDTYYFEAQNRTRPVDEGQQKEEVAEILGQILDSTLANEQLRKLSLNDAKLRKQHVPLFSQLYKEPPVVELEHEEVQDMRVVDEIEAFLHSVVDEVIVEADTGKFNLTKEILHVRGIKPID